MKYTNRKLKVKSLANGRDLGGLVNKDGRKIKTGLLYRSASLDELTKKDADQLYQKYGLRKVIDLRTPQESTSSPDKEIEGIENIKNPIFEQEMLGVSREKSLDSPEVLNEIPDMNELYPAIVLDKDCISNLENAVRIIMNNRDGAILWHCTAGKDRCGLVTMIILHILGMSLKTIRDDYMLTNIEYIPIARNTFYKILLFKHDKDMATKVYNLYISKDEYLDAALDAINNKYGNLDNYVKEALHIRLDECEEFRKYVLE